MKKHKVAPEDFVDDILGEVMPDDPEAGKAESEGLDEESIQSIVAGAINQALEFVEADITPDRTKAQRYMDGKVDIGFEPGTSSVVATKIRDTVRTIQPALMRIFLSADKPVEFVPSRESEVEGARQATDFVTSEFDRLNGFGLLSEAMYDALVKKTGFIKAYWDEVEGVTHHRYTNLTDEELSLLQDDEELEVEDIETEDHPIPPELLPPPQMGPDGQPLPPPVTTYKRHACKVSRTDTKGTLVLETIAPEDFFIDAQATCLKDAYIYGHQSDMRVSDIVEMGFDLDDVLELGQVNHAGASDLEKEERNPFSASETDTGEDDSMRLVTVTECYMRMDIKGTGVATLYRFFCGGPDYKILEKEEWTGECIAVFQQDPIPHSFFGNAIPDLLFNDQDAATAMIRGILNNIALVNTPRTEVNDDMVNMDDAMNNEIGGFVRVKAMGNIVPLTVPFVANETLGAVQYFDAQIEAKTGVSSISSGLNPDVLQSQTATAVDAMSQAAGNTIEGMARNLARGYIALFKIMLRLLVENSDEEALQRMEGDKFVKVDPRIWNSGMDMRVNVGLGTGRETEKLMALQGVLAAQEKLVMSGSPMVGPKEIRNTLADMLTISGIRGADRYFKPVPDDAQAAPPPNQNAAIDAQAQAIVQAEQIKADAKLVAQKYATDIKAQVDKYRIDKQSEEAMAGAVQSGQQYSQELDLKRDEMAQQLYVDIAKILGDYGVAVDVAAVKQTQAATRGPDGTPANQGPV